MARMDKFKTRWLLLFSLGLSMMGPIPDATSQVGQWTGTISGVYSQPIGSLGEWFKAAPNFMLSLGQQSNEKWFLAGSIEYGRFTRENLSGYAADKLELSLEHIGFNFGGRYNLVRLLIFEPYFHVAAGLYQWQGIRGEIQADSSVTPYVPFVAERKLSETNWGFHAGLGVQVNLSRRISLDFLARYRFIIGDLWPTMQPLIELEGISGFQTLNLTSGICLHF